MYSRSPIPPPKLVGAKFGFGSHTGQVTPPIAELTLLMPNPTVSVAAVAASPKEEHFTDNKISHATLIYAAAILAGTATSASHSQPPSDLSSILLQRLAQYHDTMGALNAPLRSQLESLGLSALQHETALQALLTVERLAMADVAHASSSTAQPLLGTRDLNNLRTLLSIVFKWGVDPLISNIGHSGGKDDLSFVLSRLRHLVPLQRENENVVSVILMQKHVTELLRGLIVLGWYPSEDDTTVTYQREVSHLLKM